MLSALLSLRTSGEDSEPRQDDSYECRVVLLRRDVSIERLCRQHYFRPPVAGLEDPVRRPWPALIKNVSFVVELEDHIAAIPCYLPGNLVYANLSMGMGIVDITIDTLNGTFRKRMPTPLNRIFLLDDPGIDSFSELMLAPKTWRRDKKSVTKTLTNTEVKNLARMQLVQEQGPGYFQPGHPGGSAAHNIFEKVGKRSQYWRKKDRSRMLLHTEITASYRT